MRRTLGLAAVSAALWLAPAPDARAQFSLGYDSYVYGGPPPAQYYYNQAGFSPIYSDRSTAVHADGTGEPGRTAVPQLRPPYEAFNRPTAGLNGPRAAAGRAGAVAPMGPLRRRAAIIRARR